MSVVSCNKDEIFDIDNTTETHLHEEPQGFISFKILSRNIGKSSAFTSNIEYFNMAIPALQARGGDSLINAYIDTSTIHLIEADGINYYTLKIINNNPDEKANTFYNLVFEENLNTGEVTSSILQYNPELKWLFDKSQSFEGDIYMFKNTEITIDDLSNGIHLEEGRGIPMCPFATASWECPNGHPAPGQYGNTTCGGGWVITIGSAPCSGGSGGGGGSGGSGNGSGNGSGGGGGGSG